VHIRSWMIAGLLCFTASAHASSFPHFGGSLTLPIITKDPQYLKGYRAALWYQPDSFLWSHVHVFFDASFGHWWVTNNTPYKSLNIYSIAPVFRYYFTQNRYVSPFLNASIGLAYLTRTRLNTQNLGMHFAFQDQLGLGVTLGAKHQFSVTLSAMHYSNGSLCRKNAGITIPLVINAEYGFA